MNELSELSKGIIKTIEEEDREYNFKMNKGYVERNIPAHRFKKKLVGLGCSDFERIISNEEKR